VTGWTGLPSRSKMLYCSGKGSRSSPFPWQSQRCWCNFWFWRNGRGWFQFLSCVSQVMLTINARY